MMKSLTMLKLALAGCLSMAALLLAQTKLVVSLTLFDSDYNSSYKMDIRWETESESDIAGFNVYRSTSLAQIGEKVNSSLIYAEGTPTKGAAYDLTDEPASSGRYYYQLAEVSLASGNETFHRPNADGDSEADYDDFVKVFEDQEDVTGGEYFWFNEGTTQDPGDGRKLSIIVTSTGISGSITVKQMNAEPADAPNASVCPWRWEISEDVGDMASVEFFYNPADISGTPENKDYIGIAKYETGTQTWRWLGGTVYTGDHKVRLDDVYPGGLFALYRRIFGDISGDGYVDIDDYQKFGDVWNVTSSDEFAAGSDARFFNYSKTTSSGKQIINLDDFQVFGDNWNKGTPK